MWRSCAASCRSLRRITSIMPRSMVSTTSAWCSASRAAQAMASDGVGNATGSRWRGRLCEGCGGGATIHCSSQRASRPVRPMNDAASATLNSRWKATTCCGTARQMLLQQRTRLRQPGHGEQAAGQLEDQVAHRQAARGDVRARGGQHTQHATADVGAEHQAQRHARRQHARAGQRGRQQHDGQGRIGQHRQHRADQDVEQHVAGQRGQQLAHRR